MSYDPVNVGAAANDGTGDPVRDGFVAINTMLGELYTATAAATSAAEAAQEDADTANAAITGLRAAGFMHLTASTPVAVTIGTAGTFVGIGGPSDFTGAELVGFTVVNDGTNAVLQYNGTETLTAVEITVMVSAVASAGTKQIEARFSKNAVVSTIKGPLVHSSGIGSVTHTATTSLATGDRIKPVITNNDDTTSINVHRVSVMVRR